MAVTWSRTWCFSKKERTDWHASPHKRQISKANIYLSSWWGQGSFATIFSLSRKPATVEKRAWVLSWHYPILRILFFLDEAMTACSSCSRHLIKSMQGLGRDRDTTFFIVMLESSFVHKSIAAPHFGADYDTVVVPMVPFISVIFLLWQCIVQVS